MASKKLPCSFSNAVAYRHNELGLNGIRVHFHPDLGGAKALARRSRSALGVPQEHPRSTKIPRSIPRSSQECPSSIPGALQEHPRST